MPIFRDGAVGIFTAGEDAVRLSSAMETAWRAYPDLWDALRWLSVTRLTGLAVSGA